MAWFLLHVTTPVVSHFVFFVTFVLSSLDGKKGSTVTGALSTSTTVRPHWFFNTSPLNHLLTSVYFHVCPEDLWVCVFRVCAQTQRTHSGRTLACRVQLSQDPWVVSTTWSAGSHAWRLICHQLQHLCTTQSNHFVPAPQHADTSVLYVWAHHFGMRWPSAAVAAIALHSAASHSAGLDSFVSLGRSLLQGV